MSTHAKLFGAAITLVALGLLLGFFPIHASTAFSSADCGSAFASRADEFYGMGRDLCEGKVAMLRYPAVALLIAAGIAGVIALASYNVDKGTYRNQRVPR